MNKSCCLRINLLLLLSLIIFREGQSQQLEEDLHRIQESYENQEFFSVDMEAHVFSNESDQRGKLHFSGSFKKRGDQYYTKTPDREILLTEHQMISVNHEQQKIVLGRANPDSDPLSTTFSLDSLLVAGGEVRYQPPTNGIRKYHIEMPEGLLKTIVLEINDSNMIRRVIYHYQSLEQAQSAYAKMEVNYRNFSFDPPALSFFSPKRYRHKKPNGQWAAGDAYTGYRVEEVDYTAYLNNN